MSFQSQGQHGVPFLDLHLTVGEAREIVDLIDTPVQSPHYKGWEEGGIRIYNELSNFLRRHKHLDEAIWRTPVEE